MVLLDLLDKDIRVQLRDMGGGKARLIVEYPREEPYRRRIMDALSELLAAESTCSPQTDVGTPAKDQDG